MESYLPEHGYLRLNVLDFVISLLEVDDLDGDDILGLVVKSDDHVNSSSARIKAHVPFEDLAERAFANSVELGEQLLRVSCLCLVGCVSVRNLRTLCE